MDWQTLLTIVSIGLFIFVMMRGCGGMMRGGCGMGMGSQKGKGGAGGENDGKARDIRSDSDKTRSRGM